MDRQIKRNSIVWPALFFLLLAILMLRANPFDGETIGPFDLLVQAPGYQSDAIDLPWKHKQHSDVLNFKLPQWIWAKDKLRQGELPWWNSSRLGGEPGWQNPIYSNFTPAFVVFALVPDNALGLYWSSVLNLLLIGLGSYLFFKALTHNPLASVFAACVFSYSGFIVSWFYWHHVNTAIWMPWLLYFFLSYVHSPRWSYLAGLSAASALMVLGGFPSVAVYAYLALGLLMLYYILQSAIARKERLLACVYAGAAILFSLLLVSPALFTLAEYLSLTDLSWRKGGTHLTWRSLAMFVDPKFFGRPMIEKALYVGLIPVILLGISVYSLFRTRDWKLWYAWSLLIISTVLACGILPHDWIRALPLIGKSPWGRLAVLMGLSLAMISALVLARIRVSDRFPQWLLIALMMLLIPLQVIDQRKYMKEFVNPVPAKAFYPSTEVIEAAVKDQGPLQSVFADLGYQFSGTLNAYGLKEWFAHGYHSTKEKALLNRMVYKPWKSATAAKIKCSHINFDSRLLDLFSIRQILCNRDPKARRLNTFSSMKMRHTDNSGNLGNNNFQQTFSIRDEWKLDVIEPMAVTFQYPRLSGHLKLRLLTTSGQLLGVFDCGGKFSNNQRVSCRSDKTVVLQPGAYRLGASARLDQKDGKLAFQLADSLSADVYVTDRTGRQEKIVRLDGWLEIHPNDISAIKRPDGQHKYLVERYDRGRTRIINTAVTGNAYFLSELSESAAPDYSNVDIDYFDEKSIVASVHNNREGWLVFPLRWYPGWKADVNGVPAEVDKLLGVLAAIPVPGGASVRYYYQPDRLYALIALSLLLLAGAAAWLIYCGRKDSGACGV